MTVTSPSPSEVGDGRTELRGRCRRLTSDSLNIGEHIDELKHRLKIAFLSYVGLLAILLLAPAEPAKAITFTGTYVPFVAFFLARVKIDLLPAGWTLIANNLTARR